MRIRKILVFSESEKSRHDDFFIPTIVDSQIVPVPVSDNLLGGYLPQAYIVVGVILVSPAIGVLDMVEIHFSGNVENWEFLPDTKPWVDNGKGLCTSTRSM